MVAIGKGLEKEDEEEEEEAEEGEQEQTQDLKSTAPWHGHPASRRHQGRGQRWSEWAASPHGSNASHVITR